MSQATNVVTARTELSDDWPLILAAAMGVGLSAVHGYTVGVFMEPVTREFGWHADRFLLGQAIVAVLVGVGSPFSGRVMDRIGARPLALAGTLILAAGTAAIGIVPNSLPAFLACFVVVALGTIMCSAIVWQRIVVGRFKVARGLALSIVLCGSNVAGSISPILATMVIETSNWRSAYFVLAGYMLVSTFPLAWCFFREREPEAVSTARSAPDAQAIHGLTPAQAGRTREFWILVFSFTLAGIGITGYIVHLVPMLTAQGLPLLLAAGAVSGLSVAAICGRLMAGAFMDHVFAPRLAAAALALPVAGSLGILLAAPSYGIALLAAVLVGLSTGAEFNMISYLTARYFGLRHFGTIAGILYGVFTIGCLGGQQLPSLVLRWGGTYHHVITLFGSSFMLASLAMLLCRPYATTARLFTRFARA